MESLKKFILAHGEKAILAIVVLVFGYSTLSLLTKDSNILDLPASKTAEIDPQDIQSKINRARSHLQSNVKVMPNPQAEKVSYELAKMIIAGNVKDPKVNLQWFEYVQPSPVGAPPLFAKPEAKSARNIPAEYRTRFGNPQNFQVWASVNKVLIICRESDYLNYPKPDSRRMLLWRKAIGSGKEKINPEARKALLRSPRSQVVEVTSVITAQPKTEVAEVTEPTDTLDTLEPGMPQRTKQRRSTPVKKTPTPVTADWGITADAPINTEDQVKDTITYEQYKQQYEEQDVRAFEDMKNVCTPESVISSSWELVTPTMYALKVEPTEEVLKEILTNGVNPDIAIMSEEELKAYNEKKDGDKKEPAKKEEAPKAKPDWEGIMAPKVTTRAADDSEQETAAQEDTSATPRYYVYIDKNVQQNMVYRYGVISSLQPQMPPKDILENEEYASWDIYCEVDGILGSFPEGGAFAPVARFVKDVFKNDMSKMTKGIIGARLKFAPCYATGSSGALSAKASDTKSTAAANTTEGETAKAVDTGPKVRTDELRDDKGRLTKLGWAYKNKEFCYSDFVYSDLVLTPKEFEIQLLGAFGGEEPVATFKIHKVKENGETISSAFRVTPPQMTNSPTWLDFLKKGDDGKPVWPPKILSITEVYSWKGKLEFKPIGEIVGRKGDFTTGWGLVEIRPFIIRGNVMRFKDGEWKKVSNLPQRQDYAAIIAEINPPKGQQRRFARVFRAGPPSKRPEVTRFDYEYIWEPELEKKIEQRKKSLGK